MNDQDELINRIRKEAPHLAFVADDEVVDRVVAGIRRRIDGRRDTVTIVMSRWFAPLAALLVIIIGLGLAAMTTLDEPTSLFGPVDQPALVMEVQDGTIQ